MLRLRRTLDREGLLGGGPSALNLLRLLVRPAPGDSDKNVVQPRREREQGRE
jgi:hypothetical protein